MPVSSGQDTKARAIRLVRQDATDYPSEYAAITVVGAAGGMNPGDACQADPSGRVD